MDSDALTSRTDVRWKRVAADANRRAKAVKVICDEVWREICNYLEDEIGAGLRTRMDEPFKGCKRCTAVLVGTRNVVRLVGNAAIFDFLSATSDRLDQKLDPELSGRCRSRQEE